jgi:hypothetical protein
VDRWPGFQLLRDGRSGRRDVRERAFAQVHELAVAPVSAH